MYSQEEITKAFGPYVPGDINDPSYIEQCITEIASFPSVLSAFADKLNDEQLNACYREGSWTFRQVIHHIADSHMNAFGRFKLALTEDQPVIKPYIQNAWADCKDSTMADPRLSVTLLEALHARWVILLHSLSNEDLKRTYIHPEYNKVYLLGEVLGLYAWHGKHHYTQMYRYASNQGWI